MEAMKLFKATSDDSDLKLAYVLRTDPDPIRASPETGSPRTVEVRVIVSNPRTRSVELKSVVIRFPLGQDIAAHLSGQPRLPVPVLVTPGNWTVDLTAENNGVLIKPTGAASSIVFSGNPLIFAIPGIQINTKPGAVALDITEKLMEGDLNPGIAELEKLEADFPVSSFTATPNTITDLKQAAMLHWVCTPEGQKRSYSVHSEDWRPRDCVVKNECYTCSDGVPGVGTGMLTARTDFYLDVVQTQGGQRKVQKTLSTRVDFAKLELEDMHHLDVSATGRIARVGWLARNAVRCSVFVNDKLVDDNAPADTYLEADRYCLGFPAVGEYRIEVVAHGVTGAQTSRRAIGPVKVAEPVHVVGGGSFRGVGITANGKLALLLSPPGPATPQFLDIPRRELLDGSDLNYPKISALTLLPRPQGGTIACFAMTTNGGGPCDLPNVPFVSPISVGGALSLSRRLTLHTCDNHNLQVFDFSNPGNFRGGWAQGWGKIMTAAITPDEKTAYVAMNYDPDLKPPKVPRPLPLPHKSIGIIDLTGDPNDLQMKRMEIVFDMDTANMAMSPDATRLILTGTKPDSPAKVVDLNTHKIIDSIPGAGPAVAFMPDGRSVLVGSEKSLGLYHLGRKEFQKWNANFPAGALAIASSGTAALAASSEGKGVYLL